MDALARRASERAARERGEAGWKRSAQRSGSGVTVFAQDRIQRILEMQLFFLEIFDDQAMRGNDARFHVLDLLIELVVTIEESREVFVVNLEVRDLFSIFGKHSTLLMK
jgi:hypothetical protein